MLAASVVSNLNNTQLTLLFNINSSSSFPSYCSLPLIGRLSSRPPRKKFMNQRLCCVKLESSTSVEFKADQMNQQEKGGEEEDWMMELQEKCCKEKSGMVEVMECLEKEAIMGDDQGREPTDYHRRAQIFDKSSRVFQALKEHTTADPFDSHVKVDDFNEKPCELIVTSYHLPS